MRPTRRHGWLIFFVFALSLWGCGGGGGGVPPSPPAPAGTSGPRTATPTPVAVGPTATPAGRGPTATPSASPSPTSTPTPRITPTPSPVPTATPVATAFDLSIADMYLTQGTQNATHDLRLVAGRTALLRVFVVGNQASLAMPSVNVTVSSTAGTQMFTIAAPLAPPTAVNDLALGTSWNLVIPGNLIAAGLNVSATVNASHSIPEASFANNTLAMPASRLNVVTIAGFKITLVQLAQPLSGGGTNSGDVSVPASYTPVISSVHPIPDNPDVSVRMSPLTLSAQLSPSDVSTWSTALNEISAAKVAEGGTGHYYGVAKLTYGSGIVGLGYIGEFEALGGDGSGYRATTTAHEVGHNLSLFHAPCGGASSPDPLYPYAGAGIGQLGVDVYGYAANPGAAARSPLTYKDLMSYCSPAWVSDYNYNLVMTFLLTPPVLTPSSVSRGDALLVFGQVDANGTVHLEPVFRIGKSGTEARPGPYTFEALAGDGTVLARSSFRAAPVADATGAGFAFTVPIAPQDADRMTRVRIVRGAQVLFDRDRRLSAGRLAAASLRAGPERTVVVDGQQTRMAIVRDVATNQITAFVRSGPVAKPRRPSDVLLSEGVTSTTLRL